MDADELQGTRDPQTFALIGAAMAVHTELGHGFLEAVYQEALAVELNRRKIEFKREVVLPIHYSGQLLSAHYFADFVCFNEIIVELKAIKSLDEVHFSQVINYLKATGLQRAVLLNFGATRLQYRRIVREFNLRPSASSADNIREVF